MTQLHYALVVAAEWCSWALVVGFALWRGDRLARRIALALALSQLGATLPMRLLHLPKWWYGVMDAACLALMLAAALREVRPWVLWACGFQLASVATTAAYLLDRDIGPLALATAANTWWMLTTVALAWGTVEAVRGEARPAAAAGPGTG